MDLEQRQLDMCAKTKPLTRDLFNESLKVCPVAERENHKMHLPCIDLDSVKECADVLDVKNAKFVRFTDDYN